MSVAAGFYDAIAGTLAEGRALAEARMDSLGRFFYETGRSAVDPTTGISTPIYADRATDVPCRFAAPRGGAGGNTTHPADTVGSEVTRELSIPIDSPAIPTGDFFELTTVGPLTDPALADVRFRVVDPGPTSQATARRLKVEVDL